MTRLRLLLPLVLAATVLAIVWPGTQPAGALQQRTQPRLTVVRLQYDAHHPLQTVAAEVEPWNVIPSQKIAIIGLTDEQLAWLDALGYSYEIDELETAAINTPFQMLPNQGGGIPGFPCYRTVQETFTTASQVVANNPDLAEWTDIGDSWEKSVDSNDGDDLQVLRLTNEQSVVEKSIIFIVSGLHARELAPPELATRMAEFLVDNYGIDPDVTWMLDYNEFHFLLQANPDGRSQVESGGSFWRKNTNENYCSPTSSNRGADLNRNFPFQWACCNGSSGNQCSEVYRGPFAVSEPEVEAIRDYERAIFPDQRDDPSIGSGVPLTATGVFIDVHSSGEWVLWPWGHTPTDSANSDQLTTFGKKMAYFNDYQPVQAFDLGYVTDGTTDDFAYGDLGVSAYTFEVGTSFFQSCSSFESTVLPDNLEALLYAGKVARRPYQTPAGPDTLNVNLSAISVTAGTDVTLTARINDTRFNQDFGVEPTQNISAAIFTIDAPPWSENTISYTMEPVDGNFNQKIEDVRATVDTGNLTPGQHTLFISGQDAAGNWGALSAIFLDISPAPPGLVTMTVQLDKLASHSEVWTGQALSYTLSHRVTISPGLTATVPVTTTLYDAIPAEFEVITESIQLSNGGSNPQLYDETTHSIQLTTTNAVSDSFAITLTYQVTVGTSILSGTQVTNSATSTSTAATIGSDDDAAASTVTVWQTPAPEPPSPNIYLPLLVSPVEGGSQSSADPTNATWQIVRWISAQ